MARPGMSSKETVASILKEASDKTSFLFQKLANKRKTPQKLGAYEQALYKNKQFLRKKCLPNRTEEFNNSRIQSPYAYPRSRNSPNPTDMNCTEIELFDAVLSSKVYGNLKPEELLERISGKNSEYKTPPFPLDLNLTSVNKGRRSISKSPELNKTLSIPVITLEGSTIFKPFSLQSTPRRRFKEFSEFQRCSNTHSASKFQSPSKLTSLRMAVSSIKAADSISSSCKKIISDNLSLKSKISKGADSIQKSYKACKNYTKMIKDSNKRVEFFMLRQKILRKKDKIVKKLENTRVR